MTAAPDSQDNGPYAESKADLHRNEIGALERGEKNISFVNLLRVCAAPASRQATCSPICPSPALCRLPPKRTRSGHREK
jgi:hypothetical protein